MTQAHYALFITGNPGTGKSFIANQLGAAFQSGFSQSGCGVTKDLQTMMVAIGQQRILLIDAPGLIEHDLAATRRNAKEITKALKLGKNTPCKIGIIVSDCNGRIQHSDLLLIKKVHEALMPEFEMLLIVNQIKRRNLANYENAGYLEGFVKTIHDHTKANVSESRVVAIRDFGNGERPNIEPLIRMLASMPITPVKNVYDIFISDMDFDSFAKGAVEFLYTLVTQFSIAAIIEAIIS